MKNLKCKVLALTMGAIVFIGGKAFAQVPSYVPTNGLVGLWPFNGNANDESGNGNNGTVNGATLTSDRFGVSNSAQFFSGSNTISVSNGPQFDFNDFTVAFWIKTNQTNSNIGLISKNISGGIPSWWIYLNHANTTFGQGLVDFYLRIENAESAAAANNSYNDNSWHFVIAKRKGLSGELTVIIDGVDSSTTIGASGLISVPSDLLFGHTYAGDVSGFYIGSLDDIGIWNRALTPQEISDLFVLQNCSNDLTISPISNSQNIGGNATFTATTSDPSATFAWQSDFGQGFQTLNIYGNYSGTNTNTLTISNVQFANHNQQIRAISTSGNCIDTSNVATIQIANTCITNITVYDTLLTTVIDTLIINTTLGLPAPNNENTILIYPNPASDHITIDNGNFAAMAGYSIKIENNAGQQVFQSAINQAQFYVDLSTWTGNGLYFVHLIDPQNNTVTVRKIVLQ